jgi:hypothetical protein
MDLVFDPAARTIVRPRNGAVAPSREHVRYRARRRQHRISDIAGRAQRSGGPEPPRTHPRSWSARRNREARARPSKVGKRGDRRASLAIPRRARHRVRRLPRRYRWSPRAKRHSLRRQRLRPPRIRRRDMRRLKGRSQEATRTGRQGWWSCCNLARPREPRRRLRHRSQRAPRIERAPPE